MTDSQIAREEIARLVAENEKLRGVLRVTAAVLQAEMGRTGGKPFTGNWSIPALNIRTTVDEALDAANEALEPSEQEIVQ
jgi:hypothetical protein